MSTTDMWSRVSEVLKNKDFVQDVSGFDRRALIKQANDLKGPRMRLLHWSQIVQTRRIPHSDDNLTVDAIEGINMYGAARCEIFMVSHRWLRPSLNPVEAHPDSVANEKARALNEFSRWRRTWVYKQHGFSPEIFYWIDFCCIDQHNMISAIPLLPLWVACCERFLRIETEDYHERAWCRLEPLLSYVFQFADHHTVIKLDFKCPRTGLHCGTETMTTILDPREGKFTDPSDMIKVEPIIELAMTLKVQKNKQELNFGQTTIKCFLL
ncbi:unnamed protein product [Didymodactylos carnosus]|uniref:Heterokaryon incompatibility domain-containing protein n=1 Tax=Didymodactylos carnosus TaxID=1234261 RepID=A0A815DN09_9BILA|nr:unnamed protein product [Didymodactylos carnosus]CAF1300438.1 unnamed protein product [Didymodactylos carnosus]CAF3904034.1 unnamed protein product [Didymodactylos carnosus]CAF4123277.1 unnamed protein product [Didymodactylos carnosus]